MATIKTPELVKKFLMYVEAGDTISKAARKIGTVQEVICEWMREDREFAAAFVSARVISQRVRLDECHDIMEEEADVQRARLKTEFRRWEASKLMPAIYGDRIAVDVTQNINLAGIIAERDAKLVRFRRDPENVQDAELIETKQLPDNSAPAGTAGEQSALDSESTLEILDPLGILK